MEQNDHANCVHSPPSCSLGVIVHCKGYCDGTLTPWFECEEFVFEHRADPSTHLAARESGDDVTYPMVITFKWDWSASNGARSLVEIDVSLKAGAQLDAFRQVFYQVLINTRNRRSPTRSACLRVDVVVRLRMGAWNPFSVMVIAQVILLSAPSLSAYCVAKCSAEASTQKTCLSRTPVPDPYRNKEDMLIS